MMQKITYTSKIGCFFLKLFILRLVVRQNILIARLYPKLNTLTHSLIKNLNIYFLII